MRNKLTIIILIGVNVLLLAGTGAGHYLIQMQAIPEIENKINASNAAFETFQKTLKEAKGITSQMDALTLDKLALTKRIPAMKKTFDDILEELEYLRRISKVSFDPNPSFISTSSAVFTVQEQLPPNIIKIPLQMNVYGKFFDLVTFVDKIESLERYMKVFYYVMESQKETDELKLTLKVNTYLYVSDPGGTQLKPYDPTKSTTVPE